MQSTKTATQCNQLQTGLDQALLGLTAYADALAWEASGQPEVYWIEPAADEAADRLNESHETGSQLVKMYGVLADSLPLVQGDPTATERVAKKAAQALVLIRKIRNRMARVAGRLESLAIREHLHGAALVRLSQELG